MIHSLCRLFRLRLSVANGAAAAAGYLLVPSPPDVATLFFLCCGVALLAAAGSALNQVQERDLDALMSRTCRRPLPQGDLTPWAAALIGVGAAVAGLLLLSRCSWMAAACGLLPLVWYLAVYTPLKRRTSLAVALGALCGAFPPLIGWCAAGGDLADHRALALASLLYLWQIPHFWLFQRRHADDYRRAGLPLFSAPAIGGYLAVPLVTWLMAVIAAGALLPVVGAVSPAAAPWLLLSLVPMGLGLLRGSENMLAAYLNVFPLLLTLTILWQKY